jgi:hypothetical protein
MGFRVFQQLRVALGLTVLVTLLGTVAGTAAAQTRSGKWNVDAKASLAWWQINPHMAHLWATTCPQEPSWRPGEGRSAGWFIDRTLTATFKRGYAVVDDTTNIPLYPRYRVRPLCTEAIEGEVTVQDIQKWTGVTGWFTIDPTKLVTGEDQRDRYARSAVFETQLYPEIRYQIDSVVNVKQRGDTLLGDAMGVLTVRRNPYPVTVNVLVTREAGGIRVRGKSFLPVQHITETFGMSSSAFGLGVEEKVWKQLFMGVDLLLRAGTEAGS